MNREVIEQIKNLNANERRNIPYDVLVNIVNNLNVDEQIELSKIIGYPVYVRLLMNKLKHKVALIQDGSAAIILNNEGQILLQSRADRDKWGLPGGCQELGERFQDTIIREIKEETNLNVKEEDLKLINVVSGMGRMNSYPNGDIVINNTALYLVKNYNGEIKWDYESKNMKFFDLTNLPQNQNDPDLIKEYIKFKKQNM